MMIMRLIIIQLRYTDNNNAKTKHHTYNAKNYNNNDDNLDRIPFGDHPL